jgi:hypothetical protein
MDNFGDSPVGLGLAGRVDQLEASDKQHCAGRKARRVGNQPSEAGLQTPEVADGAKNQIVAARPLGAHQTGGQGFQQGIQALAALKPASHHVDCGPPGSRAGRFSSGGSFRGPVTHSLTRLINIRSTLRFTPVHKQP